MRPQTWFEIRNQSAESAEIDIFDAIGWGGITAADFVTKLRSMGGLKTIRLNIDCPGGECDAGFTIYDAIVATKAKVEANIIGVSASMASVIMLAADKIRITENGRVMVHRVTGGVTGNPDEMESAAKRARQVEDRIIQIYQQRTGQDEKTLRDWMKANNGTWFFGQEAVDAGFAHEVLKGAKARAFRAEWAGMFTMLPAALFDSAGSTTNPAATENASPMKLTDAEKARLHALLRKPSADHSDAEKTELKDLSTRAQKEGYDALSAIQAEDAAAKGFTAEQQGAITNLVNAAIGNAIAAAVNGAIGTAIQNELPDAVKKGIEDALPAALKPITDRVTVAENLVKSGIAAAAGGGSSTKGSNESDEGKEGKTLTRAEFNNLSHPERNTFFREKGKIVG